MHAIKLIAFDIGGVLATINKDNLKKTLGTKEALLFNISFEYLQRGLIHPKDYLQKASESLGLSKNTVKKLFLAVFQVHKNARYLLNLRHPYVFASNINSLHFEKFIGLINTNEFARLNSALSYKIRFLKPEMSFFSWLIQVSKLKAEQIIFIDDKARNIEAARMAGLRTAWCESLENLPALLVRKKLMASERST